MKNCFYCTNPNVAFAGDLGPKALLLCKRHAISHRQGVEVFSRIIPINREPRYRYFEHGQWRFCWTTEPLDDGRFAAFIYKPVGRGARSGNAKALTLAKEVKFAKRSTAKARALKWYEKARAS